MPCFFLPPSPFLSLSCSSYLVMFVLTDLQLREVVVACDDATTQLRLREAELTRARAEIDRLEDKLAALESDVASLRAEADGAASHAKEVGRSYHIRKDEYVALEAKFKVVADEVVQVRTEKEVEIAELKLQLETESRKVRTNKKT